MKEKYFIIEPLKKPVKGYYFEGDTWNGWEQPCFERTEMLEIIEEFKKAGYKAWEEEENNCFVIVDDPDVPASTLFKSSRGKDESLSSDLYQGTNSWTWETTDI